MKIKDKYIAHMNSVVKFLPFLSDAHDNFEFLNDLVMIRDSNKKLYKIQKEIYLYPAMRPIEFNKLQEELHKLRRLITSICNERLITVDYFGMNTFEFKKLEMSCRLTRNGVVLNTYLDL